MALIKKFYEKFIGRDKLSEAGVLVGHIFDEDNESELFFDTLLARLYNFDQANDGQGNKAFASDVDFITQCVTTSLSSSESIKKFSRRIDSYFYIYRRLDEYLVLIKRTAYWTWTPESNIKQSKEKFLELLSKVFVENKGLQPNLCIKDKDHLTRMNIGQYLFSITKINRETMNIFLVLCRLSFQSTSLTNVRLEWKYILANVQHFGMTIQEMISAYIDYELGFRDFRFDLPGFVELVKKNPPTKHSSESAFVLFIRLCKNLNLNIEEFFYQYRPLFENGIKQKLYTFPQMGDFFNLIGRRAQIFDLYFSIYATSVDLDDLWTMFINIARTSEFHDATRQHLALQMSHRTQNTNINSFLRYMRLAKECLVKIKNEHRPRFLEIVEKIFNDFVNKQLNDEQYSHQYTNSDLKDFFNLGLEFWSRDYLKQTSSSLIIRRLLFSNHTRTTTALEKVKDLFRKVNDFDPDLCEKINAESIIRDEWFQEYLLTIPEDFLSNSKGNIYQYLCDHHLNNLWNISIWKRITHLSLLKVKTENINEILRKVNDWMHLIKHDHYEKSDTLTNILVINLFELLIVKYTNSVLSLPNIEPILNLIRLIRDEQFNEIDIKLVDEFFQNGQKEVKELLLFQGSSSKYRQLLNPSIAYYLIQSMDIEHILKSINSQRYQFPLTDKNIESIVGSKPKDIDVTSFVNKEFFFKEFIKDINEWFRWFEKFLSIFSHVIGWLKTWNVVGTSQLYNDIHSIRDNSLITPIQIREILERTFKVLRSFKDLRRLCHLFNCLESFHLIDAGALNNTLDSSTFLRELKQFRTHNFFRVDPRQNFDFVLSTNDRQDVQWSIISEIRPCNLSIRYQTTNSHDDAKLLFQGEKVSIEKYVLQGEFESQRAGELLIRINNQNSKDPRTIWYRLFQTPLSTCHLFNGIFDMFYQSSRTQSFELYKETDFSQLLDKVFLFIDNLLNGNVKLDQITDLKAVFCDKNINVREEVKKLFTNRSSEGRSSSIRQRTTIVIPSPTEKEIEQVCEWLQIYQYYSHVNIIIDCIQKFDILNEEDQLISSLKRLQEKNCSLKEITQTYQFVKEQFGKLSNQHLQLIKTALQCSAVIQMMKKSDLYSSHGHRRFQELRDNLTTQFQLQERNNTILNSWIITYELSQPFGLKANHFNEFVERFIHLPNFEENSVKHLLIVNENIQIVNMWLSAEETTVLDNALLTMEYLYRSGTVKISLRRLMNEQSFFQIGYSIEKTSTVEEEEDQGHDPDVLNLTMSMSDVKDHERQLTFCNVDLQENLIPKKILLNEQLQLLQIVENIYHIHIKLEMAGHPDYQLKEQDYRIHDRTGEIDVILTDLRKNLRIKEDRLKRVIKSQTDNLELIYRSLEITFNMWITHLKQWREENCLFTLFSNRQIMILIILLSTSTTQNPIKCHFLEKLSSVKDLLKHKEKERKLTIHCLRNYFRSLRIMDCDLSEENISRLYQTFQIEPNSNTETGLRKLSGYLRELFNHGRVLLQKKNSIDGNEQYILTPTSERVPFDHELDLQTCSILLNLFGNRFPSFYQILWCSIATEEDIRLFFLRIRTFKYLIFVLMNIDQMHHRLREILLNEQDALTRDEKGHGSVYYFSRELTTNRKGLKSFPIPSKYRDSLQTYKQNHFIQPQIQIIYGIAGIGKTHYVNTKYKTSETSCFSINDSLNLSSLISSFLSFDWEDLNVHPSISLNISIHAPFEDLNRTLLSLFVCGTLIDGNTGLIFSLPEEKQWKFFIEIPHTEEHQMTLKENFNRILPILSIVSPKTLEEITNENYQLFIGEEEELLARFLKAYENGTINRLCTVNPLNIDQPVHFERLTNPDECRHHISHCMTHYASYLPKNKISQLSFTKFLYRRIRFFTGPYYCYNMTIKDLGSSAMKQMINEAKSLAQIDFRDNQYSRIYFVYDPGFSLYLLHKHWNDVPSEVKHLFNNQNPSIRSEFEDKDYFSRCLSWLIDIKYEHFQKVINETKFILTENFAYKLFHVHERKLTRLSLIIEGDTGVGKTFLLKFYSLLLNANVINAPINEEFAPHIRERLSLWLLTVVIIEILEKEPNLFNQFLQQMKPKLMGIDEVEIETIDRPYSEFFQSNEQQQRELIQPEIIDPSLLNDIKTSLQNFEYPNDLLCYIWKSIITITSENAMNITQKLIVALHDYVTSQMTSYPMIQGSYHLQTLLEKSSSTTIQTSIDIFNEYLIHTEIKPLFYRLLLHPGITEDQLKEFMIPICQLAREIPRIELVIFFDEVNTSSCLGLFKEMFMDRTLHGKTLPENIFFTAAINPSIKTNDDMLVHRQDYLVHQLPQALENLKVSYGAMESSSLRDYITKKIQMFHLHSSEKHRVTMPLEVYAQEMLADAIIDAQNFCEEYLGKNSVSQREIQRCFNLIEFFWRMRFDDELDIGNDLYQPNPIRCIALSLALIYYFRLPTEEDNTQRKDHKTPPREQLAKLLSRTISNFSDIIEHELEKFVNTDNFVIPQGVAINQAVREHIFSIVVSIVTRTPLCIIGAPGQSKTLSFQIVLQNLQGSQLSMKPFCKRLPAIDPFFCLGSKYSRSEDIAYIFERALKREQHYEQNRMETRCVVFLDEASLPDEKKMVLKVLHPYLDECKVAFVAVANKSFDAANANRMICVYRSLPSQNDQKILAYGCLGLPIDDQEKAVDGRLQAIISGICRGYRRLLETSSIPQIYHDRDLIYMLRELRFELTRTTDDQETRINGITPQSLLRALEENFNGVNKDQFEQVLQIFFDAVQETCPDFRLPNTRRNVPNILEESMKLDSIRRRLYGRYKLLIDQSEDESAVGLLSQSGILDLDPNRTTVFRLSDFIDDIHNELRNVEILSTIKLCMETGKTILMVNTGRIHGSLYDVFNQNFSIMATGDMRKIFSKVAIGPKTIDVVVHEDFQCIVHVKQSEFKDIPAPFLSRFQKYSLSINDFYRIRLDQLSPSDRILLRNVEEKLQTFLEHFGREYFYGLNENTLYSCLLSLIQYNEKEHQFYLNIHQHFTQLTITSKPFIEQNPSDIPQCLLRSVLSKLIQLLSPESILLKLPTFENSIARWLCKDYFHQQEHFNIENFIEKFISNPSIDFPDQQFLTTTTTNEQIIQTNITRKVMIFTRTSPYVISLNEQSKCELFGGLNNQTYTDTSEQIIILNLTVIENSEELEERFEKFEKDEKSRVLILVINARLNQQRFHIPYVRQLIDKSDYRCDMIRKKSFLLLVHSPSEQLYHQSSFPSIFLNHWDIYFFDSCASGSSFHLQKFIEILSQSVDQDEQHSSFDNTLCDFNILFDDCLWDFCSQIQILLPEFPEEIFEEKLAYQFYQRQTNTLKRVQLFQEILHRSTQLQKRLVNMYLQHLSNQKDSSKKIYSSIYQISKEILCGKRFDGLVESIQSQTRLSFSHFICNVLKYLVNDYGLDTLSRLSNVRNNDHSMLELIDSSLVSINEEKENLSQRIFPVVSHYGCIPQTPLFDLFHQRIKSSAEQIKLTEILKETEPLTFEQFRLELIRSIVHQKVLNDLINEDLLQSYSKDLVRTFCTIVEKNFDDNLRQCEQTIEFVARWLLLVDENDQLSLKDSSHREIWLLAHLYSSFEYDQHDLFSLYSACRITDRLDPSRSFYQQLFSEEHVTRSGVRENLFRLIFDYLWKNLSEICSTDEKEQTWIQTYTFISKYYPSEKVLARFQLMEIKDQIDLMNLAYLIFLNDQTPQPKELISRLLENIHLPNRVYGKSMYLKSLSKIIEIIEKYFEEKNVKNVTLMIDFHQWIINMFKSMKELGKEEMKNLFKDFDHFSLAVKQVLFDQLIHLYLQSFRSKRLTFDCWDRLFDLFPFLFECILDDNLFLEYHLPIHPSIINATNTYHLFDLLFFYLQRLFNEETIKCEFINKIIQSPIPLVRNRPSMIVKRIFEQFKEYFLLRSSALLLCQTDISSDDQRMIDRLTPTIIETYLSIDEHAIQLTEQLQIFLSTIILKRSWNFLLHFFHSDHIQRSNRSWATILIRLLQLNQSPEQNKSLQFSHQIQFTLSTNETSSIFPHFHRPYKQLKEILNSCVNEQQWTRLSDWIDLQRNVNSLTEIKVMLLLNIYYDYYCNQQLTRLNLLLPIIENKLELLTEELQVFRVFLKPEEYLIGYPKRNDQGEKNFLTNLFLIDCKDEDELSIRHTLVNLLAMILLGGKQSFLWTFAFQPLTLQKTFGFGSTTHTIIQSNGVHYDCGCIITQNGDLMQFERTHVSALNVPAVYVAYFSTFGAMAWHLLLYNDSVQNLHGPILAKHAIADNTPECRLGGNIDRTKVCHFVRARLLSAFHFLSIRSNENDTCILLNRCFERMAFLTMQRKEKNNSWIKPLYNTINEELEAEQEFQNEVFYFIHQKLAEHKSYINQLDLQSQIQHQLQDYIIEMPILVQFVHFKTELHNPKNSHLPLKVLKHVLDSIDFLKMTKWICNLSQFYLLLHQTYTQLVEREEFHRITLEELYNRGEKHHSPEHHRPTNSSLIINNGIEAVNAYHQFTDGLIRPGACDQTQRFTPISRDTPIHYLVTTQNHDEGDILMRILNVLVNYHNSLLDLLEKEANSDDNHVVGPLKSVINDLTSKEISLLQIVRDNTGVITFTDEDCLTIEQLSRASLIRSDDQTFEKSDTSLNFDFLYLQSFFIRNFLLLCRINHQHIIQNYQCYLKRTTTNDMEMFDLDEKYSVHLNEEQLEKDWKDFKEISFDKLDQSHQLLRQIIRLLIHQEEDFSQITLQEFLQSLDNENTFNEQLQQCQMKDFQLCYIDHVRKLYEDSLVDYQHLFTDVSQLLRTPLDPHLDQELREILNEEMISVDYEDNLERMKSIIQTITDLLNDFRSIENFLVRQWTHSLKETCDILKIDNILLAFISNEIKCENYVALSIHLIRTRTILQERTINIEEKQHKQWYEHIEQTNEQNHFLHLLTKPNSIEKSTTDISPEDENDIWPDYTPNENEVDHLLDRTDLSEEHRATSLQEHFEYPSLFELNLQFVSLSSSTFFEQIHQQQIEPINVLTTAQKLIITHPGGKVKPVLWRMDNFFEKLRAMFITEKYDSNIFVVIDKNEILVDFLNNNAQLPRQRSLEYSIVEKTSLFSIQFHFRTKLYEYFATGKSDILSIINRFITDNDIQLSSSDIYLCFFDEFGQSIEQQILTDLAHRINNPSNRIISITVIEENTNTQTICEMTLRFKQEEEQRSLFHPTTLWTQINHWLKKYQQLIDPLVNEYEYFDNEQKRILDQNQSISSTKSTRIDGISRDTTVKVIFSYETNSVEVNALKSTRICHLLNNEYLLKELHLIDTSPNDCVLVLGENNQEVLSQNDIRQSVSIYSTNDNQPIHFRISISIQIVTSDHLQSKEILLSNRNTTIEHLLQLAHPSMDPYKYLASNYTKRILDPQEKLSNLFETKFILVEEHQICFVSIGKAKDHQLIDFEDEQNEIEQRFTIFATIAEICRENEMDTTRQFLLYSNDFVPSLRTSLISFLSFTPIRFTLIETNLPITVNIQNNEDQQSTQFHCAPTISVKRLSSISSQLFNLNTEYYKLMQDDLLLDDDDVTLDDIDSTMTQIQFQLVTIAPVTSSIRFNDQTVRIPCSTNTLIATLIEETLCKFHIPQKYAEIYELIALADERIPIEDDIKIEDVYQLFSPTPTVIPFELLKKET